MAFNCKIKWPQAHSRSLDDTDRRCCLWLFQVICLLGLIVLLTWLATIPKKPSMATLTDFSFPTTALNLSPNGSSVTIGGEGNNTTTMSYTLEIENPNKYSDIYYDDIVVGIFLGNDKVGEKTIGAFKQGKSKTLMVKHDVSPDPKVVKAHSGEFSTAKAELRVTLVTQMRYKTWGKKSKRHNLNLQGVVPVGSDGKIRGKKKKIKLHHSSKKWRRIDMD